MTDDQNVESKNTSVDDAQDVQKQIDADPLLKEMPEIVPPQELTVAQSADFNNLQTFVAQAVRKYVLPLQGKDKVSEGEDLTANYALGEIVVREEKFFRGLAVDVKAFDKWAKGRTVAQMFRSLDLLVAKYTDELGK